MYKKMATQHGNTKQFSKIEHHNKEAALETKPTEHKKNNNNYMIPCQAASRGNKPEK